MKDNWQSVILTTDAGVSNFEVFCSSEPDQTTITVEEVQTQTASRLTAARSCNSPLVGGVDREAVVGNISERVAAEVVGS